MQVENLNLDQLKSAQAFFDEMGAPVTHKTYDMDDMNFAKRLTEIENSLERLESKLDRIFGGHVLIDAQWRDITNKSRKSLRKAGFNHNR